MKTGLIGIVLLLTATTISAQRAVITIDVDSAAIDPGDGIAVVVLGADATISPAGLRPSVVIDGRHTRSEGRAVVLPDGTIALPYSTGHTDSIEVSDTDVAFAVLDSDGQSVVDSTGAPLVTSIARSLHAESNPHIVPLDSGMIVVYDLLYREGDFAGDRDIAGRWIPYDGSDGATFWVSRTDRRESTAGLYLSNDGSVVVVIESTTDRAGTGNISAVRITREGVIPWSNGAEAATVAAGPHDERNAVVSSDLDGGGVIVYELAYSEGPRRGDVDLVAQRLSDAGIRLWTDRERPPIVAASSASIEISPAIAVDSTGITVAFESRSRTATDGGISTIVAVQRLDLAGGSIWNEGSRSVPFPLPGRVARTPMIVSDGDGGAFVVVEGKDSTTGASDAYAQFFTRSGTPLWESGRDAVPVFTGPKAERPIGLFRADRRLVVIARELETFRTVDTEIRDTAIVAQALDIEGDRAWNLGENNLLITKGSINEDEDPVVTPLQ